MCDRSRGFLKYPFVVGALRAVKLLGKVAAKEKEEAEIELRNGF